MSTPWDRRQLTLGELRDALLVAQRETDPYAKVEFDFCHLCPTKFDSYRGYYDHIALGFTTDYAPPTLKQLLERVDETIGHAFEGYKGGTFRMGRNTPVWVDRWGDCSSTMLVGVRVRYETLVILQTAPEGE